MAAGKSAGSARGALPAEVTSFVGRRHELAQTRRLLSRSRLLTLTGPGGVGKTRMAMRMAADVRRTFRDGVWFVELAALQDPQLLANTIATTLELRQVSTAPASDLAEYLEDKRLLLVLDNCEHLTEAVAVLTGKLLASAPDLRVLATSRHLLGVEGEQVLQVPPLSTPGSDASVRAGDATHYESVALFVDRARAVAPDFVMTDAHRATVLELCRRLEGIPLAIELAAVWLRVLSPAQVLERLEDRFRLLSAGRPAAPARQQALDTAIGWSYDLCSTDERLLWSRLSVFSGGFDLEGAEEVCAGDPIPREEVLGLIGRLVNKSIVTRQSGPDTTAWYTMLETIREYGAAQLHGRDDLHALRVRHRDHYCRLAAAYAADGFSPRQGNWFVRLRREQPNVRAALDFCLEQPDGAAAAMDIAAPLWNFWFAGFLRIGHRYLQRALERDHAPTLRRAQALWAASYLAMFGGDFQQTRDMLAECEKINEEFADRLLAARVKECRGHATLYEGDLPGAIALLEDGLADFRAIGDPLGEFDSLILLTAATFFLSDDRAAQFSRQALEITDRYGAASSKAYALWSVGIVSWRAGRLDEAGAVLREAIELWLPLHDLTGISFAVQALSWCAASSAPDEYAGRLLGAAQAVWRISGAKVDQTTLYHEFDQAAAATVRTALGDRRFEEVFAEGAASTFEQAITLARGHATAPRRARRRTASGPLPGGLTRREQEIAVLLADGLTNKEIAARLVISQRTAETHVENILSKLGFTSRTQVGSWVAEQRAR